MTNFNRVNRPNRRVKCSLTLIAIRLVKESVCRVRLFRLSFDLRNTLFVKICCGFSDKRVLGWLLLCGSDRKVVAQQARWTTTL